MNTRNPGDRRPYLVRLPEPAWAYVDSLAAKSGRTRTEQINALLGAWSSAGEPETGVPSALLEKGVSPDELRVWRAVLWAASREACPLSTTPVFPVA